MAENVEHLVDTTVAKADNLKVQTADVLEEAARRLREADLSVKGNEVKAILNNVEDKINQLKSDAERKVAPVEDFITDHPLVSVLLAVGAGFMIGSALSRRD